MFGILLSSLAAISTVKAHVALWDKGMFGINYPLQVDDAQQNYQGNDAVNPLRTSDNLSQEQWWLHGRKAYPPRSGDFLELPAGGVYTGELATNRAFTQQFRNPNDQGTLINWAAPETSTLHLSHNNFSSTGPLNVSYFGGTALAIAYTSDINAVQPTDMTVISVNYASPWTRWTNYAIPADLPPCPAGGCICTWNWIHQAANSEGYPFEIYNVGYRCKINGAKTGKVLGKPRVPVQCDTDPSLCVTGPKQPMYLYQVTGNNISPNPPWPPIYQSSWGWTDGAQNDIFVSAPVSSSSSSSSSSSAQVSSTSKPSSSSSAAASTSNPVSSSSPAATSSSRSSSSSAIPPPSSSSIKSTSSALVVTITNTATVTSTATVTKTTTVSKCIIHFKKGEHEPTARAHTGPARLDDHA